MTKRTTKPAKPRTSQTVYLRIDNSTMQAIDLVAERESRSRSSQVAHILKQFVRDYPSART